MRTTKENSQIEQFILLLPELDTKDFLVMNVTAQALVARHRLDVMEGSNGDNGAICNNKAEKESM